MAFVYWKYLSNATRLGGATALLSHTAQMQELGTKQQLWAVKMNTTPVIPGEPAYLGRHVERLCSCNAYGPSLWKGDKDYTEGGEEGRQGVPLLKKERGKKKESFCTQPAPYSACFTPANLHKAAWSFTQILTNPCSSTSTCEAAA